MALIFHDGVTREVQHARQRVTDALTRLRVRRVLIPYGHDVLLRRGKRTNFTSRPRFLLLTGARLGLSIRTVVSLVHCRSACQNNLSGIYGRFKRSRPCLFHHCTCQAIFSPFHLCPCPPAHDLRSRVSDLVHALMEMN